MKTTHCRTMRRPDGTRVKVEVRFEEDYQDRRGEYTYKARVYTCQKGKRTWVSTYCTDDFSYRKLGMELRHKYEYDSMFPTISEKELDEVKKELWLKLEPTLNRV